MIHIENTPNPNALKFLSEKKISSVGTQEFQKANIKKIDNYFIKSLLKFCVLGTTNKFNNTVISS